MARQILIGLERFWYETCCKCSIPFVLTDSLHTTMIEKREQGIFYCPHGHPQCYATGETELDKMRRERDRLAQQVAYRDDCVRDARNQRDMAERRLSAAKGRITKIKKRVGNGVCPCCNRTFSDLARHMASQHTGYKDQGDVEPE